MRRFELPYRGLAPILADCESWITMKKSIVSILCLAALFGAQQAVAADASAGKAKAAACGGCHGADGNSPAASFPKLAGLGEKYLIKQMQDIRDGARPVVEMTGQLDNMSEEDIADIAAYYDSQNRQLSGARDITLAGSDMTADEVLRFGERVYRGGNIETGVSSCTGCHSPSGNGNTPAGYPALGGQHADYIEKQLRLFRNNERTNDGESKVMQGVAAQMNDKEIKAVANYISGLK